MAEQQISIFPSFCAEVGHEYETTGEGYYKRTEDGEPLKDKVFRTIFCTKCGDNREIMVMDRTIVSNGDSPKKAKKASKKKRK